MSSNFEDDSPTNADGFRLKKTSGFDQMFAGKLKKRQRY